MFRRLLWLTIGIMVGVGASQWLMRFVRETLARLSPERVASDLADGLRRAGDELAAALRVARQTMKEREQELRRGLRDDLTARPRR